MTTLTAVSFREGDRWVAQCLEIDVAAQGDTPQEAKSRLMETLVEHIVLAGHYREEPFHDIPPAPQRYWAMAGRWSVILPSQ